MNKLKKNNIVTFPGKISEAEREIEAIVFAAAEPLSIETIESKISKKIDVLKTLEKLKNFYSNRGINLICISNKWSFRTSQNLSSLMSQQKTVEKKLSKAAIETLAIIVYHQPVTRSEIEDIRGVSLYKGLMDTLLDTKWVNIGPRRDTPGMPVTYVTSNDFLDYFRLHSVKDLPNFKELKEAGFLADFKDEEFGI